MKGMFAGLFVFVLLVLGCGNEPTPESDGEFDTFGLDGKADNLGLDHATILGVLSVANTLNASALKSQVGLDRRAATSIFDHRRGGDTVVGTVDDNPFDTLEELDGCRWVGPVALSKLAAFATREGYVRPHNDHAVFVSSPVDGRNHHSVVRLDRERFMVVGGWNGTLGSATFPRHADIFDARTGTWTKTGPVPKTFRDRPVARFADGVVVSVPGPSHMDVAMIWDEVTNEWHEGPTMSHRSGEARALTLSDERVLFFGGWQSGSHGWYASTDVEILDPVGQSVERVRPPFSLMGASATLLSDGRVVFVGGCGNGFERAIMTFDPAQKAFDVVGELQGGRCFHSTTLVGDELIVVGGRVSNFASSPSVERINLGTMESREAASMPAARRNHFATETTDGILVFGGYESIDHDGFGGTLLTPVPEVSLYVPAEDTWYAQDALPSGYRDFEAAFVGGRIHAVGGSMRGDSANMLLYASVENTKSEPMDGEFVTRIESARNFGQAIACRKAAHLPSTGLLVCVPEGVAGTYGWMDGGWREIVAPASSPAVRTEHALALNTQSGRLMLFGGKTPNGDLADTWEFDGTRWLMTAAGGPPKQSKAELVWDDALHRMVLIPGFSADGAPSKEVWEWKGTRWSQVEQSNQGQHFASSRPRVAAYDAKRNRVVLFGLNAVWELTGSTWQKTDLWAYDDVVSATYDPSTERIRYLRIGRGSTSPDEMSVWSYPHRSPIEIPESFATSYDVPLVVDGSGTIRIPYEARWPELPSAKSQMFEIRDVARPNQRPVIRSQSLEVQPGVVRASIFAGDPDGQPLTWTVENLPSGASFSAGVLRWDATYASPGVYTVNLRVSDGALSQVGVLEIIVRR